MSKTFILPDLGEGIAEAQVVRLLVKEGDSIAEDQNLLEVETDKAAVEIPSPYAGVAERIHVAEGQTINVGDVIITFGGGAGESEASTQSGSATTAVASPPIKHKSVTETPPPVVKRSSATQTTSGSRRTTASAAPAVRRLARELGVDLDQVKGTGPGGRVTKPDVEGHAAGGSAPAARARARSKPTQPMPGVPGTDTWGPVRRETINQIRKTISTRMSRSAFTAVHVTHCDDVDISDLDRMRRELNDVTNNDPKLTLMPFVLRATTLALQKFPIFNASFDEEAGEIIYKDYVNIGIAVDTDRGLIVPVIRNADQMGLRELAHALREIADRIRANRFEIEDLRGGTFTITNVGALGGTISTPIINYPEVAILGLGRSRKMPVVRDDQIVAALVLPLNLSFDHRVTDGANAARFTSEIAGYLRHPAKFLLD